MSVPHEKARLLLQEERWEEAATAFRDLAAVAGDSAETQAGLSRCCLAGEDVEGAEKHAVRAVELNPDATAAWTALAAVEIDAHRLRGAQIAVQRALAADATNADALGLAARIHELQKRFTEARATAEQGLVYAPMHRDCARVRARVLLMLGRAEEARVTIREVLANLPDDPLTAAEEGWSALERGDKERAQTAFLHSLQIEARSPWAREGLVVALPPLFPGYSAVALWMMRQFHTEVRKGSKSVLIDYALNQALVGLSKRAPRARALVYAAVVLRAVLAYVQSVAGSLSHLLLTLHPEARPAVTRAQRSEGTLAGIFVAGIATFALGLKLWKAGPSAIGIGLMLMMLSTLGCVFGAPEGWPRRLQGALAIATAAVGAYAFVKLAIWFPDWAGWDALNIFIYGSILIQLLSHALRRVQPVRRRAAATMGTLTAPPRA